MDDLWRTGKEVEIPEEALKQTLENYKEESFIDGLVSRAHKSPFMIAGMIGLITVCGIGAYKWKTRTSKASLFFIQLRVAAQGTALGCISIGMLHQMYQRYMEKQNAAIQEKK